MKGITGFDPASFVREFYSKKGCENSTDGTTVLVTV